MAKWGDVDFGELKQLADTFNYAIDNNVVDKFIEEFLLEMAMRSFRRIRKNTPVGVGTPDPGNLRRQWKVGQVKKFGNSFQIEIFNNTEYAAYVEYGHRTGKDLTGWVEGRFMMTIPIKKMEKELPRYLEKRMVKFLNDLMNGRKPR